MRSVVPIKVFEAFSPEIIKAMETAFSEAWEAGITIEPDESDEQARKTLALYIIEMAQRGETDSAKLRDGALTLWMDQQVAKARNASED